MIYKDILIYITVQCKLFALCLLLGAALGLLYDVLRIFRIAIKHNFIMMFFEDLIYCLIWTSMLILTIFCVNSGVVRWFALIGSAGGFFVYFNTLGRLIIKLANVIITFIKKVLLFIWRPVKRCVIFLRNMLVKFIKYTCKNIAHCIIIYMAYNRSRRLIRAAACGFRIKY